jgi:hypothetical protein
VKRDEEFRAAVDVEWNRALADAGIAREQARYWLCEGFGRDGEERAATWWMPGREIEDDTFLSPQQKQEAENDANQPLHRIALFKDHGEESEERIAIVGGLLRHELHHARQFEAAGQAVIDLDGEFDDIIRVKFGGLPGGSTYYNLKPLEQDANAAAAMYLRSQHAEHVNRILEGPSGHLARSNTPPEPPETLLARTVACLYQYREVCVQRSGEIDFGLRLGVIDKRAEEIWRQPDGAGEAGPG